MRLTGMTIAFIDAQPDAIEAFNRWYDTDHIPENIALPGHMWARRYVATRGDKALRGEVKLPELSQDGGTLLTTYLLSADDLVEALGPFRDLGRSLRKQGRFYDFFPPRTTARIVNTWAVTRTFTRKGYPLALEAVPFTGHRGLYVAIGDTDPARQEETERWYAEVHIPQMLETPGFLAAVRMSRVSPVKDGRFLTLFLLDEDPAEAARALNDRLPRWEREGRLPAQAVGAATLFSGGYHLITPLDYSILKT